MWAVVLWMKTISYGHCNYSLRILKNEKQTTAISGGTFDEKSVRENSTCYPSNVTVKNMCYFLLLPTLCYQLEYPSTGRIRYRWLIRRVFELGCVLGLMMFMTEQYVSPMLSPTGITQQYMMEGNYRYLIERVMKLSIPVLYIWLLMFYALFHLWLNILSGNILIMSLNVSLLCFCILILCFVFLSNRVDMFWRSIVLPCMVER